MYRAILVALMAINLSTIVSGSSQLPIVTLGDDILFQAVLPAVYRCEATPNSQVTITHGRITCVNFADDGSEEAKWTAALLAPEYLPNTLDDGS
jgi:hypothetical protein